MHVVHTSAHEIGQVYLPAINWILLLSVVAAVIGFGSSTNLASAYGIAVTGTMLITTVLTFWVIRYGWGYNWLVCIFATGFFLAIDVAFFSANSLKIAQGGWFPLVIATGVFVVMMTWKRGREMLLEQVQREAIPLAPFMASITQESIARVPRTAVFLMATPEGVPRALLHNLMHNNVLHERIVFLTVVYSDVPYVPLAGRVLVEDIGSNFYRVRIFYGFMDQPDIPAALERCDCEGLEFDMFATSFFVSRETVVPRAGGGMAHWRGELFATMSDLASSVVDYFKIPPNRVIELGTRIEI
jgi:KUP system potassium uptake protein